MSVKCAGCGMFVAAPDTHIHEAAVAVSMSIEALASMLHVPADTVRAALSRISATSNLPTIGAPSVYLSNERIK